MNNKLKELLDDAPSRALDEFVDGDEYYENPYYDYYWQKPFGPFKCVSNQNNWEESDDVKTVYYFENFDEYVEFSGYYRSFEGSKCTSYRFVSPKQQIITVYE